MEKSATRGMQGSIPTTFVQADSSSFRELVQRLTGPADDIHQKPVGIPAAAPPSPSSEMALRTAGIRKPPFKLHERRQDYIKSAKLEIIKPHRYCYTKKTSPRTEQTDLLPLASSPVIISSPSNGFPVISPTGLNAGFETSPLNTPSSCFSYLSISKEETTLSDLVNEEEEEKAIAERRFYLHPSPRSWSGNVEPELLTLFPLTSPKIHNS